MKALSLWQPWATLIAIGAKRFETRGWSTTYRGPVVIHAAKRWNAELARIVAVDPFRSVLEPAGVRFRCAPPTTWIYSPTYTYRDGLPLGAAVAVADLVHVYEMVERAPGVVGLAGSLTDDEATPQEMAFGDWQPGRFAWAFQNVRRLTTPIPVVGRQGLYTADSGLLAAIQDQLGRAA